MTNSQTNTKENEPLCHTNHSLIRSQQRGISNKDILYVTQNSKPIYKQGLKYYSLKSCNNYLIKNKEKTHKLMNLIIITHNTDNVILTVYKSGQAWRKIKQKSKRLKKYN